MRRNRRAISMTWRKYLNFIICGRVGFFSRRFNTPTQVHMNEWINEWMHFCGINWNRNKIQNKLNDKFIINIRKSLLTLFSARLGAILKFYLQSNWSPGAITKPDDIGFDVTAFSSALLGFGWTQHSSQHQKHCAQHFFSPTALGNEREFPISFGIVLIWFYGFLGASVCFTPFFIYHRTTCISIFYHI